MGYIHVENKLYNKINQYIKFSDSKNNTPMEIISKMKDISKTLEILILVKLRSQLIILIHILVIELNITINIFIQKVIMKLILIYF